MNILLLEPNRLLAKQYRRFLEAEGHQVGWCENAQAGVAAADTSRPDLVIIELLLAGHSGIEFLYEFRSYADWITIPAIILSGVTQQNAGVADETLVSLGVHDYFYKPDMSLVALSRAIRRIQQPVRTIRP